MFRISSSRYISAKGIPEIKIKLDKYSTCGGIIVNKKNRYLLRGRAVQAAFRNDLKYISNINE